MEEHVLPVASPSLLSGGGRGKGGSSGRGSLGLGRGRVGGPAEQSLPSCPGYPLAKAAAAPLPPFRSRSAPLPSGNMVAGMLMPLGQLRSIYELLFRDGVLVGQKDPRPHSFHPELPGVSHLQVWRAMDSLRSRGLVRQNFAWRHCYWYLTDEGIAHLRQYLRLPPEIVPTTLQRARRPLPMARPASRAPGVQAVRGPLSQPTKPQEDWRQEYRRKDAAGPVESASRRAVLPPASSSDEGQTTSLCGERWPCGGGTPRPLFDLGTSSVRVQ